MKRSGSRAAIIAREASAGAPLRTLRAAQLSRTTGDGQYGRELHRRALRTHARGRGLGAGSWAGALSASRRAAQRERSPGRLVASAGRERGMRHGVRQAFAPQPRHRPRAYCEAAGSGAARGRRTSAVEFGIVAVMAPKRSASPVHASCSTFASCSPASCSASSNSRSREQPTEEPRGTRPGTET